MLHIHNILILDYDAPIKNTNIVFNIKYYYNIIIFNITLNIVALLRAIAVNGLSISNSSLMMMVMMMIILIIMIIIVVVVIIYITIPYS